MTNDPAYADKDVLDVYFGLKKASEVEAYNPEEYQPPSQAMNVQNLMMLGIDAEEEEYPEEN